MTRFHLAFLSCGTNRVALCTALGVALVGGWAIVDAKPPSSVAATASGKLASADSVACTIRAIHGTQNPGGVDKRLDSLKKQLSKPPFSAFKSFKLLSANAMQIGQGVTQKKKLPSGKILGLTFKEKLLVAGKLRLRLYLSIMPPKAKKFLPGTLYTIADGGTLLVAGDSYQKGTLVVGVTCRAK
jgi:hypothetical protein